MVQVGECSLLVHRNLDSEHALDLLEERVVLVEQVVAVAVGSMAGAGHQVPGMVPEEGVEEKQDGVVEELGQDPGNEAAPAGMDASVARTLGWVGVGVVVELCLHHGARMGSVAVVEG